VHDAVEDQDAVPNYEDRKPLKEDVGLLLLINFVLAVQRLLLKLALLLYHFREQVLAHLLLLHELRLVCLQEYLYPQVALYLFGELDGLTIRGFLV